MSIPRVGDLFSVPSKEKIESSKVNTFRLFVNHRYGLSLRNVWDVHAFSVDRPQEFWQGLWDFLGFIGERIPGKPLFDSSKPIYETRDTIHARLNWTENMLLAHSNARSHSRLAVISATEPVDGKPCFSVKWTWKQLHQDVLKASESLLKLGVKEGDRVAAYSPNNGEAVIMLLACAAIGAIWSSCPTDFGTKATLERLQQIEPVILLSADRYRYGGKVVPIYPKLEEIVKSLASSRLRHIVVVGQLDPTREPSEPLRVPGNVKYHTWCGFLDTAKTLPKEISFNRGSAMRPLWILYSSGTTGKPKAIVHTAGGMLLGIGASHSLHSNMGCETTYFQFTTLGWMMWNYQVSTLSLGCTIITFDGSPLKPLSVLWDLIDEHSATYLGISPRYLQVLLSSNYCPREKHSLKTLDTLGTAGAPVKPELYVFMDNEIKKDVFINNSSGGTDICSIFVGASISLPTYCGEIQMPAFGCRIEAWDDSGNRVPDGQEGNMVCVQPIPNEPLCFWNDPGDKRYRATYFEEYVENSIWYQGDWICIGKETKGINMLGRSDGVLNPAGVRFGSAELYAIVEQMKDEVDDCLAVGQKVGFDERVILFVKTPNNQPLQQSTVKCIQDAIRSGLSNRHVPAVILQAPNLPYTANMKRCEVAVKKVVNGTPVDKVNRSAMANPEALDWFIDRPELRLDEAGVRDIVKAKL
ncbi:acetoacetyl-CoA synthetase [Calocera viscosa TUFC12733]|uniref:Acetoacetyl-CoA synthetase n=1 Tax=Calocera viscosa (strain TUFC12733) TaxID=1330018 RepID=A0A167FRW8_CALVF|nr:acetoacetyl-CoA synthetase [Calocera viscosa TUFC12733]